MTSSGRFVIFCDHATNIIPANLHNLGVSAADLSRHIAYDIGAAEVTKRIADRLESPALFSTVSRLVVDCNRHLDAPDLIPVVSDSVVIPGNQSVSSDERAYRIEQYFVPYHDSIDSLIGEGSPITLSIHSMTDCLAGAKRPWHIALSSFTDRTLADPLLNALRLDPDILVGDNEPYDLDPAFDYSTPRHALSRNLRHLQIEFRQDLIADEDGQRHWAEQFTTALLKIVDLS